jgi:colanic acid/amylovoran biosynthesis protein
MGDVAMLQVALARLATLWPSAEVRVLTDAPDALGRFCPGAIPLSHSGRREWFSDAALIGSGFSRVPAGVGAGAEMVDRWLRRRLPRVLNSLLTIKARLGGYDDRARRDFLTVLFEADLYVVSGAIILSDKAASHAEVVLSTLELAMANGVPTAMMSQGVGPMRLASLLSRARAVLPRVDLITLREGVFGPRRLAALGVPQDRTVVTGDDAVGLAIEHAADFGSMGLGVNLRVGRSSEVSRDVVPTLQAALREAIRRLGAVPMPLPIAFHAAADDPLVIRELFAGIDDTSDGGQEMEDPARLVDAVTRCRVVVTGAYHAAVFALAQGVPAVALVANEDYAEKFKGLADQFGAGCRIVSLKEAHLEPELAAAIDAAWGEPDSTRLALRAAAREQALGSEAVYARLPGLLRATGETA